MCGTLVQGALVLCERCSGDAQRDVMALLLQARATKVERQLSKLQSIWCARANVAACGAPAFGHLTHASMACTRRSVTCGGDDGGGCGVIACESLDCPVFFERRKRALELALATRTAHAALSSW